MKRPRFDVDRFLRRRLPSLHRLRYRRSWDRQWDDPSFAPRWLQETLRHDILAAKQEGWFPEGGDALDLGCGRGVTTAWLADQGFNTLGIDFSAAAIRLAIARHGERDGLAFATANASRPYAKGRTFDLVTDFGCYICIADYDLAGYIEQLARHTRKGAIYILSVLAFRDPDRGDEEETERILKQVRPGFGRHFDIVQFQKSQHKPPGDPGEALPVLMIRMVRT